MKLKPVVPISILYSFFLIVFSVSCFAESKNTNPRGMKFVYIKPGTFMMGSPANDPERYYDEKQHRVTLTKGFLLQTTEVTQSQWEAVMGKNPSKFKGCGKCPVERVSWRNVREFIRKLNQREGTDKYRLPTEAEWEYAARAGTTSPFAFGTCLSTDQANYKGNYPMPGCSKGQYRKKTVPVASFAPNAWGLYDMHGNVWEWVQDWYDSDFYQKSPERNPKGPAKGTSKVTRGGSWGNTPEQIAHAYRDSREPDTRYINGGFRCAKDTGK